MSSLLFQHILLLSPSTYTTQHITKSFAEDVLYVAQLKDKDKVVPVPKHKVMKLWM